MNGRASFVVVSALLALCLVPASALGQEPSASIGPTGAPSSSPAQTPTLARLLPVGREWDTAPVVPPGTAGFMNGTAWKGGFAAVGYLPTTIPDTDVARGPATVLLSTDGTSWRAVSDAFGARPPRGSDIESLTIAAYGDGLLIAGSDGLRLAVWRSPDGVSWTRLRDRAAFGPGGVPLGSYYHGVQILGIAHAGRKLVITGLYSASCDCESYQRAWTTTDLRMWRRSDVSRPYLVGLSGGQGRFAAVSLYAGRPPASCPGDEAWQAVWSTDGVGWRVVSRGLCMHALDMTYDPVTAAWYLMGISEEAHGDGRAVILRSADLRAWTEAYRAPDQDPALPVVWDTARLAVGDGIVAAVGTATRYGPGDAYQDFLWSLTSSDGTAWEWSTGWPAMLDYFNLSSAAIAAGAIIAVSFDAAEGVYSAAASVVPAPSPSPATSCVDGMSAAACGPIRGRAAQR